MYLRQLEKELSVSSNTVRLELNKLAELNLIEGSISDETKIKNYRANVLHPLFSSLRGIILKYVGVDQILDEIIYKLGNVDQVYLTGEMAEGKYTPFVDLVLIGDIDRNYLNELIVKAEYLLKKKIRIAIFSKEEFKIELLEKIKFVSLFEGDFKG